MAIRSKRNGNIITSGPYTDDVVKLADGEYARFTNDGEDDSTKPSRVSKASTKRAPAKKATASKEEKAPEKPQSKTEEL